MPDKILIIDNGSHYLSQLKRVCGNSKITIANPGQINLHEANAFDLIILSGGFLHEVDEPGDYYANEIALIKGSKVPIVGICLGFQLIAHTFGMPVHKMDKTEHTTLAIRPTKLGEKILGSGKFHVYEHHRLVVSKTPQDFHALAMSKDGIEAIMHESRPLVGFQFHPEMFVSKNDGRQVLKTVLSQLNKY